MVTDEFTVLKFSTKLRETVKKSFFIHPPPLELSVHLDSFKFSFEGAMLEKGVKV